MGMSYGEAADPMHTPATNGSRMAALPNQDPEQMSSSTAPNNGKKPLFNQPKIVVKTASAAKPSMFSGSKPAGVGMFKKPALGARKKFQMEVAPVDENEVKQIQKIETKLMGPKMVIKKNEGGNLAAPQNRQSALSKASLNQISGASLNEKKVQDNFVRPMALKQ